MPIARGDCPTANLSDKSSNLNTLRVLKSGSTFASIPGMALCDRTFLNTAAALLVLALSACTASSKSDGRLQDQSSEDTEDLLLAPVLEGFPDVTPLDTVAVRGTTDGTRVVVQSPFETRVVSVLPGGSFCLDAPLELQGQTTLSVYSVGGDGRVSDAMRITVTRDESGPMPPQPRCSGSAEQSCAAAEICNGAGVDDDCNGFADACDSACNGCEDDIFEPNDDAVDVPTLEKGTYDLALCPCRSDWFAFHVKQGERIHATAVFHGTNFDPNMRLYRAGLTENTSDAVAWSLTSVGREEIDWVADADGTYYVNIYLFSTDVLQQNGTYTLTID